jgi:23S rRNA (uracil1939-C5)-methyltransferase
MSTSKALVHVRNLAVGGDFVGEVVKVFDKEDEKYLGITTFVPYAAPGETVEVQITERKERYLRGALLSLQKESENRIDPECSYYGDCGGCELQHIRYDAQLLIKFQMIQGALRAGRVPASVLELLQPLYPGDSYHFRRRIHLHIDSSGRLGFYKNKTRTIISTRSCPVAVPEIEAMFEPAHAIAPEIKGKISSLYLESDGTNVIAVLASPYMLSLKDQKEVFAAAKKVFRNFIITAEGKEISGSGLPFLKLPLNRSGSIHLKVPAGAFSQVNWEINIPLIEHVIACAGLLQKKSVYDLYAGAGNFTLPLAYAGGQVTAVETDPRLVFFGKESAREARIEKNISYHESSVEVFLKRNPITHADLVVADPPRSGLGKLCTQLGHAKKIILISCQLPSFVRDLKHFIDLGFTVTSIQPFDMFAQTSYVEIVAVLERK